jgi:hypothetical protein
MYLSTEGEENLLQQHTPLGLISKKKAFFIFTAVKTLKNHSYIVAFYGRQSTAHSTKERSINNISTETVRQDCGSAVSMGSLPERREAYSGCELGFRAFLH